MIELTPIQDAANERYMHYVVGLESINPFVITPREAVSEILYRNPDWDRERHRYSDPPLHHATDRYLGNIVADSHKKLIEALDNLCEAMAPSREHPGGFLEVGSPTDKQNRLEEARKILSEMSL